MKNLLFTLMMAVSVVCSAENATDSYLVIDLSGGANAKRYSVSHLDGIPEGGWSDEYKTKKLVLRLIQPGSYKMGSPESEEGRSADESCHSVKLTKPFYMGIFEVTQRQWELVMDDNPSYFQGDLRPVESISYELVRGASRGAKWPRSSEVDANSFVGRIRAKTGLNWLDLPTEAQWQYACRAGTVSSLNNGKEATTDLSIANMRELGRYWYNKEDGKGGHLDRRTADVGSYRPNAWGLYDMHGNVWEWCLDWYGANFDKTNVADPKGCSSGAYRVFCGGSWTGSEYEGRSANRLFSYSVTLFFNDVGFRLSGIRP